MLLHKTQGEDSQKGIWKGGAGATSYKAPQACLGAGCTAGDRGALGASLRSQSKPPQQAVECSQELEAGRQGNNGGEGTQ